IRRAPDLTRIPFVTVDAVVEVPYGCAPHECYGVYEPFLPNLDNYANMIRSDPEAGVKEYIQKYIKEPESWAAYLDLLGMENLVDAGVRGRSIYND
ncbi:MAG: CoA transferase subunit A, partial [Proteobacteria bacterium]|nr:CoA transferase subunit A [Pseudomonadota bacterium]